MIRAYTISADDIAAERERVEDDLDRFDVRRVVKLSDVELPAPAPGFVRVRVLVASIEHNVIHAALSDTINIVALRGGSMSVGNCFVGEVLECGRGADRFRPGEIVISGGTAHNDPYGYPLRIPAYDQPHSHGCYAEETLMREIELKPAPLGCGLNLYELVSIPLRGATANHLWRRGESIFRAKVGKEKLPRLNVLAFGGGTSEFFLMLARSEGHEAFYCSASPERRAALEKLGIRGIDQEPYQRFATEGDVQAFGRATRRLTQGAGMHVVCDMFRGPVFEAGLAASAREGVNVSAGWQLDVFPTYNSARLSLSQITLDHVHFETVDGCDAVLGLVGTVFRPHLHKEVYCFEDVPRALHELYHNTQGGLPVTRIAEEMPASVRHLVPEV
jgi:NADPH:quinone reductase-like Zn-dependent oxidoreductase